MRWRISLSNPFQNICIKKYKITYNLTNKDIDIILIIDPRKKSNKHIYVRGIGIQKT